MAMWSEIGCGFELKAFKPFCKVDGTVFKFFKLITKRWTEEWIIGALRAYENKIHAQSPRIYSFAYSQIVASKAFPSSSSSSAWTATHWSHNTHASNTDTHLRTAHNWISHKINRQIWRWPKMEGTEKNERKKKQENKFHHNDEGREAQTREKKTRREKMKRKKNHIAQNKWSCWSSEMGFCNW